MKKTPAGKWLALSILAVGAFLGFQRSTHAQTCWLTFPPGGSAAATVSIEGPWAVTGDYTAADNPSYFISQVTTGNAEVPAGTYLGWCIDATDNIDAGPESYNTLMFSSCDTNLNNELMALGISYPSSVYVSPAVWNQVNYILNNQNGAYFWNVQQAIWTLIGGPAPEFDFEAPYPPTDTNQVNALVAAATNNAASWTPECGSVIGVIVAELTGDDTNPVQLTMIVVPYPCVPCIAVTKEIACLQPTNNCAEFGKVASGYAGYCGGSASDQPAFCYQLTLTNCGTVPLSNIVVSDSLLGLLTTNFVSGPSEVLLPGTGTNIVVSMSVATTTTNTVTATGQVSLTNTTVTNINGVVVTNGATVSATDSAVAQIDAASVSCNLTLYSPYDTDGNSTNNQVVLPSATYFSTPLTVTLSINVCNTGVAALQNVTVNLPALSQFNCTPPAPFSLAPGACQNIQLCLGNVSCPENLSFNVTVTGQVVPDTNHCGVYDLTSTNLIGVCTSCSGSVTCNTNTGCAGGYGSLSGVVVQDCTPGSTNISGDSGLSGFVVTLLGASNTPLATNITGVTGAYNFNGLAMGMYYVLVTPPSTNYVETYPVGVTNNEQMIKIAVCSNMTVNFGYANNTPPTISIMGGTNLGCNPTNLPSTSSIASQVKAMVSCGTASNMVTATTITNGCMITETFSITVTDTFGNTAKTNVIYTWTSDSTPPVLSGVPLGKYLGCNPTNIPTVASVQAGVSASDTCSQPTVTVTAVTNVSGCLYTEIFTITATNLCKNQAVAYVTNTWTIDTVPPVITGVPANAYLGCTSNNLPGDTNVLSEIKATDACSTPSLTVTHVDTTNGCLGTRTFTITALDGCGLTTTTNLVYTWTVLTPQYCTNSICCGFNSKNPGSGWLWCNAHVTGNPGQNCTLSCKNASITLNCANGHSYTYPVSNGIINFSSTCKVATNWFDGTNWNTTLPCAGDDQIFLQGCAIPWQSCFAGCQSACWTGVFSCSVPGQSFTWTWGSACFADTLPAYTNICPKACHTTPCTNGQYYVASDCAGCPENQKPYCVGGGTGLGGANCTGNFGGCDTTCTFSAGTTLPPVLNGVPANDDLGLNPTNIPTVATILSEVSASDTCSPATVSVTMKDTTNSCMVTQIFTITATNACGGCATAYVTNMWTSMSMTNTVTNTICCNFNSLNPGSGWVWCNAHISGKPGTNNPVTIYCENATITATFPKGVTYSCPVPNGQICFTTNCTTATNWFDGKQWNTILPCAGDDQIFLQGCAIPWQSAFTNCQSVCWTGVFTCNQPGLKCNWQFGAACYSGSTPSSCSVICPKACHQTACPNGKYYNSTDPAGCPENYSPYCVPGGTGAGSGNFTGTWSSVGTCGF